MGISVIAACSYGTKLLFSAILLTTRRWPRCSLSPLMGVFFYLQMEDNSCYFWRLPSCHKFASKQLGTLSLQLHFYFLSGVVCSRNVLSFVGELWPFFAKCALDKGVNLEYWFLIENSGVADVTVHLVMRSYWEYVREDQLNQVGRVRLYKGSNCVNFCYCSCRLVY